MRINTSPRGGACASPAKFEMKAVPLCPMTRIWKFLEKEKTSFRAIVDTRIVFVNSARRAENK